MHEPFDASIIIFALLAIFVLWKLRSVLGARTGQEKQPPTDSFARRAAPPPRSANDDKVVRLPGVGEDSRTKAVVAPDPDRWKTYAEPGTKLAAGLDAIAEADRSFDLASFVAGAKTAYEMIIMAFAAGNRETLRGLLAGDVYESFATAIAQRESRHETMETTLVSIDSLTFDDAALRGRSAQLTARFAAKLVTATHDPSGNVIEGNPDKVVDMIDIWTFARDVDSRDPNWKLIATQTGH
ncbi:MAG: Tim44/TimA family putative adaptor protein [Beijerinckiaceae bacterium]